MGLIKRKSLFRIPNNVILTSIELGGVGWFTSTISEVFKAMTKLDIPLPWRYETSKFEATRFRRPLPEGWINTWNADPKILVQRGFDKVIALQKDLIDAYLAMAMYMYPGISVDKVEDENPRFFKIIKRKWDDIEKYKDFKHKNFLYVHFDDLNNHTVKTWGQVLDFLEFPKKGRPMIIPVKVWRNWECYSNIQKSGNEWFETYDPLFHIKSNYDRDAMFADFFIADMKILNIMRRMNKNE